MIVHSTDDYKGMLSNLAFSLSLYSGQMCTTPQNLLIPREGILTDQGPKTFDEVTADLARAARYAPADVRKSLAAAAKGFATAQVPFDAYLDDQGRLRKLRQRFSFVNGRQKTPVAVTSTTLLYDFGAPAVVALPHERDIYAGRIAEDAGTDGA